MTKRTDYLQRKKTFSSNLSNVLTDCRFRIIIQQVAGCKTFVDDKK